MLTIKLKPLGRKRHRVYRISVFKKTTHPTKGSVEDLGTYNPYTKALSVNKDLLNKYIELNTEMSETVTGLLKKNNLIK